MRCRLPLLLALLFAVAPLHAQTCRSPRTALVLSGGGAKGLAHIGVLRVLDSLGIRPDLVVGTSIGAVVGALYASGYTGRELDSLARVVPLATLFRSYQPLAPRSLGPLQPLVVWEQGDRRFALQSASVVEAEVNAVVNAAMLRGNLLARGNFDSLSIPFRAVATDLAHREIVVLSSGDLAQAVRASAGVPLLFAPERRDGRLLIDGGLSANIPVAVARQVGAERVIVSDATAHPVDSPAPDTPLLVADRLVDFLFRQHGDSLRSGDILVRPAVGGFTSLNFAPRTIERLLALGVQAADSVLPRLPCPPTGPSGVLPAMPTRIAGVTTDSSVNASERLALTRLLGLGISDSVDQKLLFSRVRTLSAASEAYNSVWLTPSGRGDSVVFHLVVHRAPRRVAGLGIAYDNELGGRAWIGLVDRRFLGFALEGSTAVLLGELRREISAGLRRNYQLGRQLLRPTATIRLATEKVRRFEPDGDELDPARTREAIGFLGAERALDPSWEIALGAEGHAWHEPQGDHSTAGVVARVTRVTRARGRVLQAEVLWTGIYPRLAFEGQLLARMGVVRFTPRLRLGWGEHLPLQAGFPLGGDDGFPGLHLGERRGDREAMLGLMFSFPLKGPLLGRVELAGGRTAVGGAFFGESGWDAGVRAGIGADTPVGPVRFEYGLATRGRDAFFVRLGRWF
jgi:NTE family protein